MKITNLYQKWSLFLHGYQNGALEGHFGGNVKGSHTKSLINSAILQAAFPHLPLSDTFLSPLNNATLLF